MKGRFPFLDLRAAYSELKYEIDEAAQRVLSSGWYISGADVEAFEMSYAEYTQSSFCVGVGNGLDALYLALLAVGVEPGDEVIVPSNTYIATWLAVSRCGAVPVPVEPDVETYNIDTTEIEMAITSKTTAILPVHLYGQPADLNPVLALAVEHGLKVVEDAAQCQGAMYRGRRIGSHGDAVAWSFYPGKNLGAMGDGGAVTTNNEQVAERIRLLGNYGSSTKYLNDVRGVNSRLDPIQAAVLGVKLKYLDEWNRRRSSLAESYSSRLDSSMLQLPTAPQWATPVWHQYVVRSPNRGELEASLSQAGIPSMIHYPVPPHLQRAYKDLGLKKGELPIAEELSEQILSIPINPHLTQEQHEQVINEVNKWAR